MKQKPFTHDTIIIKIGPICPRFAKPIILQSESMHFAVQNPAFCRPICSILQAKTMGFAQRGSFYGEARKTISKTRALGFGL